MERLPALPQQELPGLKTVARVATIGPVPWPAGDMAEDDKEALMFRQAVTRTDETPSKAMAASMSSWRGSTIGSRKTRPRTAAKGSTVFTSLPPAALGAGNPCNPVSNGAFAQSPKPQRRGLRPLREKRRGCCKHAPPRRATGVFLVARWSVYTALSPKRRKLLIIPVPD